MTTLRQSCYYYISLLKFIKMFFRLIGVHILFCGKKFIPHVCLYTVRNRISPTKQPLIPRLARKIKGRIRVHISFLNVQSFLNVCLYTVQSVTEHPKTTSVSQPDSKKIQGLIGVHISFWGGKSILHVCIYTVPNRIFHHKTTSDFPLSSKKRDWPVWAHISLQCVNLFFAYFYIQ